MALTATSSNGASQGSSQNIQTASSGSFLPGGNSSGVQTGTAQTTLDKTTAVGIPLQAAAPSVVNLSGIPKSSTSTSKDTSKVAHHTNPLGAGLSVIFVIAAAILLWSALRPVKNTTD